MLLWTCTHLRAVMRDDEIGIRQLTFDLSEHLPVKIAMRLPLLDRPPRPLSARFPWNVMRTSQDIIGIGDECMVPARLSRPGDCEAQIHRSGDRQFSLLDGPFLAHQPLHQALK